MPKFAKLLPALLGASLLLPLQAGATAIDLGVASGYSGFFYGNAKNFTDIEGRLAVGGDVTANASIGYRAPYGSKGPSLVVGGNVKLGTGDIFNGPTTNVNTNASVGPITEYTKAPGYGVYGGKNLSANGYHDLRKQTGVVDFGAAKTQLTNLSSNLGKLSSNGLVENKWGGTYLTGDNKSDIQVFTINSSNLSNLFLQDVRADAHVVINVVGGGKFSITGGQDGQLKDLRDRLLYNFLDASSVTVGTFAYGTILANKADILGGGHLEGNVIANSLSSALEIGYEPYKNISAVPEPQTWALLMGGLAFVGFAARRRKQA
ncbi:choice-of-anchor A domain-containing protein [Massilia violacea]|uniref:Choice-of-anchor A domain-containing protein n=1 Tax=Pseudoduganella violacea TaxID=1715466 RepID=A0A7W5B8D9_9BURK|nr:choice-of-anchor A family protein [Pseudoduganella violacea]MBB3118434.1 choice-of-anchor A domain-containing protein [Pseudoduganella violacea]